MTGCNEMRALLEKIDLRLGYKEEVTLSRDEWNALRDWYEHRDDCGPESTCLQCSIADILHSNISDAKKLKAIEEWV